MLEIYKKALLPSAERWFIRQKGGLDSAGGQRSQTLQQALYRVKTTIWHKYTGLAVAVVRRKSYRKCMGIH